MERSDTIGLSVAAAGHVLLLAALTFGLFKAPKPPVQHQKSIDVSLVDAVALQSATRSPAPAATAQAPETGPIEEAAPAPAPEPEPKPVVKPQPAPPPPPPSPAPRPEPKAKPEVKPTPKPVPKPVEKPKPVAQKPTPEKAPPPPKKVAAAAPEAKKTAPEKPATKPSTSPSKTPATAKPAAATTATKETSKAGAGEGQAEKARGTRLGPNFLKGIADDTPNPPSKAPASAAPLGAAEARALNAEITRQLKPYWRAPTGADVDQLVTVLTWRLNRDGTIASGPTVVSQSGKTDSNRPQQQLHIEAAIRAVKSAAPYNLPPQYYDNWKFIEEFRFDKRL